MSCLSSEKIPSGQHGCPNFPAYKENTSTNPGYSNPPQKVYWMVIPLSIEGRMFPSTSSLPRMSSVLLICAVAVRTTSWRKAIQIIACRIFSGIHFSPSHRKIDHFSCSCYGVLFELRGITKQIPKQHNHHQKPSTTTPDVGLGSTQVEPIRNTSSKSFPPLGGWGDDCDDLFSGLCFFERSYCIGDSKKVPILTKKT